MRTTPPLIATMSLQPAIPRRVALQAAAAAPPPLHQPLPSSLNYVLTPTILQRMVNCPQLPCLNHGVHSSLSLVFLVFTLEIATWHEFGHAWGNIHGRHDHRSDNEAVAWENRMRKQVYGPLGPNNAGRKLD